MTEAEATPVAPPSPARSIAWMLVWLLVATLGAATSAQSLPHAGAGSWQANMAVVVVAGFAVAMVVYLAVRAARFARPHQDFRVRWSADERARFSRTLYRREVVTPPFAAAGIAGLLLVVGTVLFAVFFTRVAENPGGPTAALMTLLLLLMLTVRMLESGMRRLAARRGEV